MQRLRAASKARARLREKAQCAPIVNMNCLIHVKDVESENPDISVRAVAVHESESRAAVMEMMVLAGQVAAKWAFARGVPVLFRCCSDTLICALHVKFLPLKKICVVSTRVASRGNGVPVETATIPNVRLLSWPVDCAGTRRRPPRPLPSSWGALPTPNWRKATCGGPAC